MRKRFTMLDLPASVFGEVPVPRNAGRAMSKKMLQINFKEDATYDLERDLKYFIGFGKFIGLYPPENKTLCKLIPIITVTLAIIALMDFMGMFLLEKTTYTSANEICGRIGSPQFFAFGAFYYFYMQTRHDKLKEIYEKVKKVPVILEDKTLPRFTNLSFVIIMTSAILENICFHFKLFPVFEPPVENKTPFQVYYERSHGFWAAYVPFSPYHATILLIANKWALYSWNFVDLLATITSRALTFHFNCLLEHKEVLGPAYAVQRHEELAEIMRLLQKYLSPILFGSFYMDFYATCMQLHMWMTPAEHKHFLHTIYLLWAFFHLIVRMFFLSYHASRLHEAAANVEPLLNMARRPCDSLVRRQILRIDVSQKRQLAISGLGCFFITKKFLLTLIYVAFSFQIFLMTSETVNCD